MLRGPCKGHVVELFSADRNPALRDTLAARWIERYGTHRSPALIQAIFG
jgi:hypothetical protein